MSDYENSIKEIARSTGIILIGIFISKLITYLFRLITARYGVEEYGLLSLSITIITFIVIFTTIGLDKGLLKYISYYREKKENHLIKEMIISSAIISLVLSILITIVLFIFSTNIQNILFPNITSHKFEIIFKIVIISIPFQAISKIMVGVFKSFKCPQYEVYTRNIAENFIKFILALILFILGFDIISISIVYTVSIIFSTLLGFYFIWKICPEIFKKFELKPLSNKFLKFSFPLTFMGIFYILITSLDTLLLGYLKNEYAVGIYNVVNPTAQLMFVLPFAILTLFIPILTEFYVKEQKKEFTELYKTVTKWIIICNLPLLCLLIAYSKEIITILFGNEFASGSSALIILAVGYFILFILYASENILLILEKSKLIFWNIIIILLINIILNFILIKKYSINGAAIATSISFILWGILISCESLYYTKIFPFKKKVFTLLIIGGFTMIFALGIKKVIIIDNLISLILCSTLGLIIYLIGIIITKCLEKEDKLVLLYFEQKTGIKLSKINNILKKITERQKKNGTI